MNKEYLDDETQVNFFYEYTSDTKFEGNLMRCGSVFLCIISDGFIILCSLCDKKNICSKFKIFKDFSNHIKEKHCTLLNNDLNDDPNNSFYPNTKGIEEDPIKIDKKVFSDELVDIETDCFSNSDKVTEEENYLKIPFRDVKQEKIIEIIKDEDNDVKETLQPSQFVLQWPENQIFLLIDLFKNEKCLWKSKTTSFEKSHQTEIQTRSYNRILKQFNHLNKTNLQDIHSIRIAIKELVNFFNECDKKESPLEQSKEKIFQNLFFLKNFVQTLNHTNDNISSLNSKTLFKCRINFRNKQNFKSNSESLSKNTQKKICKYCGANFENRKGFIIHIKNHRKKKPFVCKVCSERFTDPDELKSHVNEHKKEKPYMCEFCGHQFKFPNHLAMHKQLHSDPSFECVDCNKKFYLKRHLNYHLRLKHTNEEKVNCDICKKTYRNKDSLLRHERKIHKILKRNLKKV